MDVTLQLQIISILMGIIGVALPALIAIVGFVYIRSFNERMDNLSDQIDQLWEGLSKVRRILKQAGYQTARKKGGQK